MSGSSKRMPEEFGKAGIHDLLDESLDEADKFSRRDFLYRFGSAATATAIFGCFLNPNTLKADDSSGEKPIKVPEASRYPKTKDNLSIKAKGEFFELQVKSSKPTPICVLNKTGVEIVKAMNGKRDVNAICEIVFKEKNSPKTSKTAIFIAQLASMGFLERPFPLKVTRKVDFYNENS